MLKTDGTCIWIKKWLVYTYFSVASLFLRYTLNATRTRPCFNGNQVYLDITRTTNNKSKKLFSFEKWINTFFPTTIEKLNYIWHFSVGVQSKWAVSFQHALYIYIFKHPRGISHFFFIFKLHSNSFLTCFTVLHWSYFALWLFQSILKNLQIMSLGILLIVSKNQICSVFICMWSALVNFTDPILIHSPVECGVSICA
jgi:hypothetical protein